MTTILVGLLLALTLVVACWMLRIDLRRHEAANARNRRTLKRLTALYENGVCLVCEERRYRLFDQDVLAP